MTVNEPTLELAAVDAAPDTVIDVVTGEVLPATIPNAARVLSAARDMKARLNGVVADATAYLLEQSRLRGTKTLREGTAEVSLTGGLSVEYDEYELQRALEQAGCPADRVEQAVVPVVTYKVNRSVLRQLGAANPDYAAAIAKAQREVERPWRASVKAT